MSYRYVYCIAKTKCWQYVTTKRKSNNSKTTLIGTHTAQL